MLQFSRLENSVDREEPSRKAAVLGSQRRRTGLSVMSTQTHTGVLVAVSCWLGCAGRSFGSTLPYRKSALAPEM